MTSTQSAQRSRRARAALALATGAGAVFALAACSLLLDWSGYSGGPGVDDVPCGDAAVCAYLPDGGWMGPIVLYGPDASPPGCGSGYTTYSTFSSPPAACSACTCGDAPTGGGCPVEATYYTDAGCGVTCGKETLPQNMCVKPACGEAFIIGQAPIDPGTCSSSGGTPTLPATLTPAARACPFNPSLVAGTCGNGQLCLPDPPLPDAPRICVFTVGDAGTCPDSHYQWGPQTFYTDPSQIADTRGCIPCQCGVVGASCGQLSASVVFQFNATCTAPANPIPALALGQCIDNANQGGVSVTTAPHFTAGSCAPPTGGAPTGTAVPDTSQAVQICCDRMP